MGEVHQVIDCSTRMLHRGLGLGLGLGLELG